LKSRILLQLYFMLVELLLMFLGWAASALMLC